MAEVMKLLNLQSIQRSIKSHSDNVERKVEQSTLRCGLLLQRESQKRVPVEYGNLRNTAGTRKEGKGFKTKVWVFYTANYAIWVHENVEMKWKGIPRKSGKGEYWGPRGQAKFLEQPAKELQPEFRKIFQVGMR